MYRGKINISQPKNQGAQHDRIWESFGIKSRKKQFHAVSITTTFINLGSGASIVYSILARKYVFLQYLLASSYRNFRGILTRKFARA